MNETERLKILEKVASGEISAAAAAELLQQPAEPDAPKSMPAREEATPQRLKAAEKKIVITDSFAGESADGKTPTWLRVRVNDLESGKQRVAVNIPFRLMKWGLKLGQRFSPELQELDSDILGQMVAEGAPGMLVEVMDSDAGEQVQIYLE